MITIPETMSAAEFDALPYEEGRRWELLEGELIAVSSPTPRHQDIVFRVLMTLRRYLETGPIRGLAYQDVEFALTERSRVRPDVCLLLAEKAQHLDPDRIPIPGAPDLAIEVISQSERVSQSRAKVLAYLQNGTAEVWQLYPEPRTLRIHRREKRVSFEPGQQVVSELLPGFACLLSSFFE